MNSIHNDSFLCLTLSETIDFGKVFDGIIYLDRTNKINWAE